VHFTFAARMLRLPQGAATGHPNAAKKTTVSIQHAAQVIERIRQVDVGNVEVPVLMRRERLFRARTLPRWVLIQRDSRPDCFSTNWGTEFQYWGIRVNS